MLEKNEFLKKYNLENIYNEEQLSWQKIENIYNNYLSRKDTIQDISQNLISVFVNNKLINVHSISARVKNEEHLIAKIIRNFQINYNKYKIINETNYDKIVTDLIGLRILMKYKEQWEVPHDFITRYFKNDPDFYMDYNKNNYNLKNDLNEHIIIEKPLAYLKYGDPYIYKGKIPYKYTKKNYRSIHYVVKFKNICCEIQLRTLAEEIYGEFDHDIRYPNKLNDNFLTKYTSNISLLTSSIDDIMSMFNTIPEAAINICSNNYNDYAVYPDFSVPHMPQNANNLSDTKDISLSIKEITNKYIYRKD